VSIAEIAIICLATVFIGISKAGFGGGTGVVATPLLATVMPAREAIGLMLPLLVMTDIMSMFYYFRRWDAKNVAALAPGSIVGILLGGTVLRGLPEFWLRKTIGVIALAFFAVQLWRELGSRRADPDGSTLKAVRGRYLKGFAAGVGAGMTSTLEHEGGVIVSMNLLPQGLSNVAFVGTTTAVFFIINMTKVPVYFKLGILDGSIIKLHLYLIPLIAVGVISGILLNRRVSKRTFSRIILVLVFASGLKLLVR